MQQHEVSEDDWYRTEFVTLPHPDKPDGESSSPAFSIKMEGNVAHRGAAGTRTGGTVGWRSGPGPVHDLGGAARPSWAAIRCSASSPARASMSGGAHDRRSLCAASGRSKINAPVAPR